ncbi:DNA-binding transcriptional regulator, FrmR family [Brevibacterium sandarakinum]|uniref:DNA-binding transcriptional regulator, FrmR family n=1 Tax=Brevibacterium sandarakinum TaxID=629680 RepID=A0A1H1QQ66_BRESA|nr:DNA-binding transcriptional regulator, FrmR family [Brevibacterium sandarakinum]
MTDQTLPAGHPGTNAEAEAGAELAGATATSTGATGLEPAPENVLSNPAAQKKIVNRLRRAQGQLGAVISAVEDGSHCRDVVHQLSAVTKALDRAGFLVISTALRECLDDETEDRAQVDELEKLFLTLA